MTTKAEAAAPELRERYVLKAFIEACLVLEDGVASTKDIDIGMLVGAGFSPPPLAGADQVGLDNALIAAGADVNANDHNANDHGRLALLFQK